MRGIAARAAMPTMTLYGYFPTKTAIMRGLWTLAFDPLFAEMEAAEKRAALPAERLRAVACAYVDYWLRHPDRYRMVHMVEDRRDGEPDWFIDESDVIPSHLRITPLIAGARGKPESECTIDAEALICALTGIVHMAITVSEYSWSPPADYVDRILPAFIH